jgi:beta-glucosidase
MTGPAQTRHPTSTASSASPADRPRAQAERSLLAALSVPDKVRLLTGADSWRTHGCSAIGLRPMVMSDGPSGSAA